jgi:hypothetical protein
MRQAFFPPAFHSLIAGALALPSAHAAVVQVNSGTGDGSIPGGSFSTGSNILTTHLEGSSRTGTFYREESGYTVATSRLFDGVLGPLGSAGLGSDGAYTVMPNLATIQLDLTEPFDLTTIRTYASWDYGRSGQGYVVKYATSADPLTFITLHTVANWNNDISIFPLREDYDEFWEPIMIPDTDISTTLVTLTSGSGSLAEDVVSLQFVFNGYQNGGTAFREFQVEGTPVNLIPEPSALLLGALSSFGLLRRTRRDQL